MKLSYFDESGHLFDIDGDLPAVGTLVYMRQNYHGPTKMVVQHAAICMNQISIDIDALQNKIKQTDDPGEKLESLFNAAESLDPNRNHAYGIDFHSRRIKVVNVYGEVILEKVES